MTGLGPQTWAALSGATAGLGAYLLLTRLTAALAATRARRGRPGTGATTGWTADLDRRAERLLGRSRARRLLLADDLAVAGRDRAAHTAARLAHTLAGAAGSAGLAVLLAATGVGAPLPAAGAGCLATGLLGLAAADRPVRRLAAARRQETRLAVASFVDLVRVLLAGGLPLHAALRTAADAGGGWAWTEIRTALDRARQRRLPPDAGLDDLATRIPLPEFAELRLTVSSALRGASPAAALASKATHLRAAEAAQARTETAVADAEMELPAAAVALAFVAFLTYPLLVVLTSHTALP
jgi:Flp pilus assembly protein TadB